MKKERTIMSVIPTSTRRTSGIVRDHHCGSREETNQNIKIMTNNSQFSLANRKHLADLLADKYDSLRYKARQSFNRKAEALRTAIIGELAEKKGALGVVRKIEVAQESIKDLTAELSELGFELYSGDLRLRDRGSNPFNKIIATRVEKEIGSEDDINARFDSAQLAMMTIASLEDAQKLLKSVSEIQ